VELRFSHDFISQNLEDDLWRTRLVGGRNLRFTHNPSKEVYWFPFQYDGQLVEDRQSLIWPSSGEWLLSFMMPDNEQKGLEGYMHNDDDGRGDDDSEPAAFQFDFRSQNPVIAMQAYLNLFAGFEKYVYQRLADVAEASQEQRDKTGRTLISSFRTFLDILMRERRGIQDAVFIFKVGELLLFIRNLTDENLIASEWAAEVMAAAEKAVGADDFKAIEKEELRNYLEFVLEKGC
jgi:hypothetical protein